MTRGLASPTTGARSHPETGEAARRGGWRTYLIVATCLAPVCVPSGPGNTAPLDFVNLVALLAFGLALMFGVVRLRMQLAAPMFLIAVGSLVAMTNAESLPQGVLAMAQDVYLYAWFLAVVSLLRDEGDLKTIRVAWMWTANVIALWGLAQLVIHSGGLSGLLGSRGLRPASTLYNPNMLADYLVLSIFIVMSLVHDLPRPVRWGSLALQGMCLLATKSNGGMIALVSGMTVWLVVRTATLRVPPLRVAAVTTVLVGAGLFFGWANAEWGLGSDQLALLQKHTFVGRMEHSSKSRLKIWDQLEQSFARSPFGIGPGNSAALTLSIADRERPGSLRGKEAHSDYLAYTIERGPLGLAGLLFMTGAAFAAVAGYWKLASRAGAKAARAGAWTAAMAGALAGSSVHSAVIEKLHFRHFWLFLGLVCGSLVLATRDALIESETGTARGGSAPAAPGLGMPGFAPFAAGRPRLAAPDVLPGGQS